MRRKNKPDKFPPSTNFILEQSPTMKRLGYFLFIVGLLSALSIIPDVKIENTTPVLIIPLLLILWTFIFLPYVAITTKKKIILKDDRFIIESNKKKYRVNQNIDDIIWWRKMLPKEMVYMDFGNKFLIKFPHQIVTISDQDFRNLYKLVQLLETAYKEREKKIQI